MIKMYMPQKPFMVDISKWNGIETVKEFKEMNAKAVCVQISHGTFVEDYGYTNLKNAKEAGLALNAYHFAEGTSPAAARAEAYVFAKTAKKYGLTKHNAMVLDYEQTNLGLAGNTAYVNAFFNELDRLGFTKHTLYSMAGWASVLPPIGWIADYPAEWPASKPFNGAHAWQFTSSKHFTGSYGNFDESTLFDDFFLDSAAPDRKPVYYDFNIRLGKALQELNVYNSLKFTGKQPVGSIKAGKLFKVYGVKKAGKTYRLLVSDKKPLYVTANDFYVKNMYYSNPSLKAVKLLKTAALHKDKESVGTSKNVLRTFPKGTIFDVKVFRKASGLWILKTQSGYYLTAKKTFVKKV